MSNKLTKGRKTGDKVTSHVWKSSDVFPVCKKESATDKTCYRPVSVLTALSKLYEKLLFDQIYEALTGGSHRIFQAFSGVIRVVRRY